MAQKERPTGKDESQVPTYIRASSSKKITS